MRNTLISLYLLCYKIITIVSLFNYNYFTYIFNYYDDSTGSCKLTDTLNGTYSYNSSTKILSIIDNGTTENNEIFKITNSEMQIITDTDDYNNDGVLDMEIAVFAKQ